MRAPWLLLLAAAGCDDHLFPLATDGGVAYTADWEGTQALFGDHCASCHPSLSAPSIDDIHADVVAGTGTYVVPGDPGSSLLWTIVNGTSTQYPLMPLGSAQPLPDEVLAPLGEWIAAGADLN